MVADAWWYRCLHKKVQVYADMSKGAAVRVVDLGLCDPIMGGASSDKPAAFCPLVC